MQALPNNGVLVRYITSYSEPSNNLGALKRKARAVPVRVGRMCSPQSSNMDDVNRLLHPVHQASAVVLQDTQEFKFLRWED